MSVSQPPRVGPSTGATTTPRANTAIASPRFSGGKLSVKIASRIMIRLVAAPHAKDEAMKMIMLTIRKRLRPNFIENQALAGNTTALDSR